MPGGQHRLRVMLVVAEVALALVLVVAAGLDLPGAGGPVAARHRVRRDRRAHLPALGARGAAADRPGAARFLRADGRRAPGDFPGWRMPATRRCSRSTGPGRRASGATPSRSCRRSRSSSRRMARSLRGTRGRSGSGWWPAAGRAGRHPGPSDGDGHRRAARPRLLPHRGAWEDTLLSNDGKQKREIVGVVKHVAAYGVVGREPAVHQFYLATEQLPEEAYGRNLRSVNVAVRSRTTPEQLRPELMRALARLDRSCRCTRCEPPSSSSGPRSTRSDSRPCSWCSSRCWRSCWRCSASTRCSRTAWRSGHIEIGIRMALGAPPQPGASPGGGTGRGLGGDRPRGGAPRSGRDDPAAPQRGGDRPAARPTGVRGDRARSARLRRVCLVAPGPAGGARGCLGGSPGRRLGQGGRRRGPGRSVVKQNT